MCKRCKFLLFWCFTGSLTVFCCLLNIPIQLTKIKFTETNMPRKEKSFFGKIMGGNVTDEEEQVPVKPSDEEDDGEEFLEIEELEDELEDSETEIMVEEDDTGPQEVPVMNVQAGSASMSKKATEGEEWMSDFEGQLNIDMYQTKDNVIIKSTIAGVRPEDIDITIANDMVTVKGSRRKEENVSAEDYFYQECYWGNFTRSVIVPVDIDSEHIEADLKDGILTIIVPKAAKAKTRKVKVKGL